MKKETFTGLPKGTLFVVVKIVTIITILWINL